MIFDQSDFDIHLEWGNLGVAELSKTSRVYIIVDVLSFSTCVEIVTSRGGYIIPYQRRDESAIQFAESWDAELATSDRSLDQHSLSPASLLDFPAGKRLVLPSPNGTTLTLQTGSVPTTAGCFRNAKSVAEYAQRFKKGISVITAGERWNDGSLRPCFEDWLGAGAILAHMSGSFSPEALAALAAYQSLADQLASLVKGTGSGKELIEKGFERDVDRQ
jgi:2-phosphosulfolactate phosphatase